MGTGASGQKCVKELTCDPGTKKPDPLKTDVLVKLGSSGLGGGQSCPSPNQRDLAVPRKSPKAVNLDEVWECTEEESLLLGLPSDWPTVLQTLSRTVSNRRELVDLLCCFNCSADSAENLVACISSSLSPVEQDKFYGEVVTSMMRWCRALPQAIKSFSCKPAEPRSLLLLAGSERSVIMTRVAARALLAAAFFCIFQTPRDKRFSAINFEPLFASCTAPQERSKLIALINYFRRVTFERPGGFLTFRRLALSKMPNWGNDTHVLPKVEVIEEGSIVQDSAALRVIFGGKVIGGGVLIGGSWQEEGIFASNPEMIAACLFTQSLGDIEALLISGVEKFSRLKGCEFHMTFDADWKDETPCDADESIRSHYVIMDAADYRPTGRLSQFLMPALIRDASKAHCAFRAKPELVLATGAWGCGNHLGDVWLKFLLQLLAAAMAGVGAIHYFSFGDPGLAQQLAKNAKALREKGVTAGQLWIAIAKYSGVVERAISMRTEIAASISATHPPSPPPEFFRSAGLEPPSPPPEFLPFILQQISESHRK